jgi:hypothetical protein
VALKQQKAASAQSTAYKNHHKSLTKICLLYLSAFLFDLLLILVRGGGAILCDIIKQMEIVTFYPEDESDLEVNSSLSLEYVSIIIPLLRNSDWCTW